MYQLYEMGILLYVVLGAGGLTLFLRILVGMMMNHRLKNTERE